jgi:hypothetical protein
MLIPLSPPIHRNRRSKPFEGFGYALDDAKGLRISQLENGLGNGDEDEIEEETTVEGGDDIMGEV